MRIEGKLFFSPKFRFIDLKWNDKKNIIEAFEDRVTGYYLKPAKILEENELAFASGVLCVSAIDFISRIETGIGKVRKRFEPWVTNNIQEFCSQNPDNTSQTLALRFYEEFRNGLIHEGRIKNAGQFSYNLDDLVKVEKSIMIVNPKSLLEAITFAFGKYVRKLNDDDFTFQVFRCALIRDFRKDIEYVNKSKA